MAVGTLNLVSVGFGVLFVGIAVDFAIQFSVRYRERRFEFPDPAEAIAAERPPRRDPDPGGGGGNGRRFPRVRADQFRRRGGAGADRRRGHADRFRLHDDLPAGGDHLVPAARRAALVGFTWAAPLDSVVVRHRRAILAVTAALAVLAAAVSPRLQFDSDPLDTQEPAHRGDADAARPD